MQALERANVVRLARVKLKRDIKAGEVLAGEVLLSGIPEWLEAMPVEDLCHSIRRFGAEHFQRLALATPFGLTALLGGLTDRQREVLGESLAEWETAAAERRARRRRVVGKGARAAAR